MQQRKNNNPESEHQQQTSNSRKSGYVNSGAETEADTTSHASIKRNRRRQRLVIHKTYRESPTKSEPGVAILTKLRGKRRRRQDWFDSWGSFFPSTVVPWEGSCLPTRGNVVGLLVSLLPSAAAFQLVQEINSVVSSVLLPFMTWFFLMFHVSVSSSLHSICRHYNIRGACYTHAFYARALPVALLLYIYITTVFKASWAGNICLLFHT